MAAGSIPEWSSSPIAVTASRSAGTRTLPRKSSWPVMRVPLGRRSKPLREGTWPVGFRSYPQLDLYPQAGVWGPVSVRPLGYYSNMRSSSRDEVVEVFDALEADFKRALDLRCDALTTPERWAVLQRCERIRRWLPAIEHPVINQ